jgi:hypothetical protein
LAFQLGIGLADHGKPRTGRSDTEWIMAYAIFGLLLAIALFIALYVYNNINQWQFFRFRRKKK